MYTNGFLSNKVDFLFHRDLFLNHHTHIYIDTENNQTIKAYDAGLDYKIDDIIAVIGEFFEREELIDSTKKRRDTMEAVSLITGESKEIETGYIVMKDRFVDSCGMASHYLSNNVIEKAYLEFFERQSFIYSFLAKENAEKIDINMFNRCKKNDFYLKNYIDNVEYYNISLDEEIFVILALGYGKRKKAIGMGTDHDIEKAINKSQNEMLQNFAVECSKSNFLDIGWERSKQEDRDMYDKLFAEMSLRQFEKEYKYLECEKTRSYIEQNKKFDLYEFILKMRKVYNMEPHVCFLPSRRVGVKVIKIIDFYWFPHMYPKYYSAKTYDFVENVTGKKLIRDIDFIPFP